MPFVSANTAAAGVATASTEFVPALAQGGKVRSAIAEFTCASDAIGTYTIPIRIPRGARVRRVSMNASVTMGASATIAIGIAGATGKYRAAATFTTANATTDFALNAAIGVPLVVEEQLLMTVAVAALPASGRLLIEAEWVDNS